MHFCYYFNLSFITCFFMEDLPAEQYLENFPFGNLVETRSCWLLSMEGWSSPGAVGCPCSFSVSAWKTVTSSFAFAHPSCEMCHTGWVHLMSIMWRHSELEKGHLFLPWGNVPQFSLIRISETSSTSCLDGQSCYLSCEAILSSSCRLNFISFH